MNTNTDFDQQLPDFLQDLSGATQAAHAGLPDPLTLTKLANAFFQELKLPSLTESFALPVHPPVIPTIPQVSPTGPQVNHFSVPGGVNSTHFSSSPSLGFLENIRPLFGAVPAVPAQFTPPDTGTVKIPTQTSLGAVPSTIPGNTAVNIPETPPAEEATPQVPGAVVRPDGQNQPEVYQFLNARALEPINVTPVLAPIGNEPQLAPDPVLSSGHFDVQAIRRDFPILQERVHGGKPLIWFDNAATTQKPRQVIDRLKYFYEHENSNVHRAAHTLAARSTDAYDAARDKVRRFLNAASSREIIFVRGATEGINLIANTWGKQHIREGDEIIVSHLEHHANIVPWQMLAAEKGARIRVAPVDNQGQILLDEYQKLFSPKTRLVAFTHVSNALGTITPVQEMVEIGHRYGAKVLVDGSQGVSHMRVDVQAYNADFYVFSGHKLFAPTGIGAVYGKLDILENMQPWQGGGNMIADVTFEKTLYQPAPFRFEAGTGNIADAVGLGAAIDYLERLGMHNIGRYEHDLLAYATEGIKRIPGLHLIGTAREKASVLSFVLDGFSTEQVGQYLNQEGIAVRAGHHCAQPILRRFGLESTVRPSLAFYNTCEEVDAFIAAVWNLKKGRNTGI